MSNLVDRLLWHVEQVCGPLSEEVCEVDGDDDRSTLKWAFAAVIAGQSTRVEKLEKALRKIAVYGDSGAETIFRRTGSYGAFDEPVSVRIARKALEE